MYILINEKTLPKNRDQEFPALFLVEGKLPGLNRGEARVGSLRAEFRCLDGVDIHVAA